MSPFFAALFNQLVSGCLPKIKSKGFNQFLRVKNNVYHNGRP